MSDPSPQRLALLPSRLLPHHRQVRHGAACTEQEPLTTTDLIVIMANSLTETVRSVLSLPPSPSPSLSLSLQLRSGHITAGCLCLWQPSAAQTGISIKIRKKTKNKTLMDCPQVKIYLV